MCEIICFYQDFYKEVQYNAQGVTYQSVAISNSTHKEEGKK